MNPFVVIYSHPMEGLNAEQLILICAAACISANLRNLGMKFLAIRINLSLCVADVSGNNVLESPVQDYGATAEHDRLPKSKIAEEARALILHMREATARAQLEQLGTALGVFVTLKEKSQDRRGRLKMQSILQSRSATAPCVQTARDAFWRGIQASVSIRKCTIEEFDVTANSLDQTDQHAVLAVLNKLVVDGVSNISVGHAFVRYPSIAVKVVECVMACCADNYLQSLNLTGTLIGNDGAVVLSRALGQRAVGWPKELHLSKCNMSDAGFVALIDALLQSLKRNAEPIGTIDLSQNMVTDEAAAAIAPLMIQLVQLHISSWANGIRDCWKVFQSQGGLLNEGPATDLRRFSCFTVQELNLESNIISEIGLKLLYSPFLCETILQQRAAALTPLIHESGIPMVEFAEFVKLVGFRPVLHNLKIGGNLCTPPIEGRIVHVCRAGLASAQECSSFAATSSKTSQSVQVGQKCTWFYFF
jgi:hypothetical protein